MPTRRTFLTGTAALLTVPSVSFAGGANELRAAASRIQLAPEGYGRTDVWTYDGQVPGRVLRLRQGERLETTLVNDLPQPTTVHWHGIRLPNGMDGVPGMTQDAVAPGGRFDYAFSVPDAGTFWYHPHANSAEQIGRGLSGVLVVDEAEAPEVDRDEVIQLSDWRMTEDAQIDPSFGAMHDMSHAGRLGNWITVNGNGALSKPVRAGERLRLRLVNTATARVFALQLQGLEGWVMAVDGMPLDQPRTAGELLLGPAQRADLIVDVTAAPGEEAFLVSYERNGGYAVTAFPVSGEAAQGRRAAPKALPPNPVPEPVLGEGRTVAMPLEGGAMRGLQSASYEGRRLDWRALVQSGQFWAMGGVAGMPDAPLVEAARGETIRIPMENRTMFPHAMHLHGHHFREIGPDGQAGPLRDTTLIQPGETREIAFVADNPGDWMLHCHMLSHQMSGMGTWIRVA
ncbi:multicopper oxidase family protein [Tranquillimonas alkanivorans]|uniref:Multicopper oxidase with three cupredoxin domains (Includes cell division protein FtsP and spore coat protein CotA) n=1 Tax=Tranquillimonas alkanivorans TaxID=441119 RepID=A0A1I5NWW9_9RHOB|nr:multicopper oxidase family protein [Tranquillimonas alkanivorans]SFP26285.1 Multicopper oxidase with three cupredoxin domains (includes cell division protein FtsP and spore coat protein CotA) [Tranquillimonas alkanivorans]